MEGIGGLYMNTYMYIVCVPYVLSDCVQITF